MKMSPEHITEYIIGKKTRHSIDIRIKSTLQLSFKIKTRLDHFWLFWQKVNTPKNLFLKVKHEFVTLPEGKYFFPPSPLQGCVRSGSTYLQTWSDNWIQLLVGLYKLCALFISVSVSSCHPNKFLDVSLLAYFSTFQPPLHMPSKTDKQPLPTLVFSQLTWMAAQTNPSVLVTEC